MLRKAISFVDLLHNEIMFFLWRGSVSHKPKINGRITLGGSGQLIVGLNVTINSSVRSNPVGLAVRTSVFIAPSATITLGKGVGISNTVLYAWKSIEIEEEVMIGGGCQIYDTDFHSVAYEDRILGGDKMAKSAPVTIRKGAFIGTSCIIMKGVTIGERSVIAAGSVVVKSVPPNEIWGGNPAKFIKPL